MLELLRQARQTVLFLRLAAIELRRAAEDAPDIAGRLHQIASKLEEDAGDLARAAED